MKNNITKQKWNNTHYTQVKVYIEPALAANFKMCCASNGVSISKAVSTFMSEYCGQKKHNEQSPIDYTTRQRRRKTIDRLLGILEEIYHAEETYQNNIPENLQNSIRYEAAGQSIDTICEAIEILSQAY